MPTIPAFEYRCLPNIFLLQVKLFNYLIVPRTEDQRNTEETIAEREE